MIIPMQGNWTVTVKSKNATFEQQFVITGANSGNGVHPGTVETSVNVAGSQWSIAILANPGTGFQRPGAGRRHQCGRLPGHHRQAVFPFGSFL